MTRKDALEVFIAVKERSEHFKECGCRFPLWTITERDEEAIGVAIEALQTEPIRCGECKHQDDCEEVVLFEINDEEVIGHRLHWCSYGERKGGDDE